MSKKLALKSFRLKNFKAIQDSGVVKFTPLTVLIGDNGSGKSSLVEGLHTYQRIVTDGLDDAMNEWLGFEYIRHGAVLSPDSEVGNRTEYRVDPIEFRVDHNIRTSSSSRIEKSFRSLAHRLSVTSNCDGSVISVFEELLKLGGKITAIRNSEGEVLDNFGNRIEGGLTLQLSLPGMIDPERIPRGRSFIRDLARNYHANNWVAGWQLLTLNPYTMRFPHSQRRSRRSSRLKGDGSNIAEYLDDILQHFPGVFEGILEAVQYVLPYMRDLKPALTGVLGRRMHLEMSEADFKVMGWLLSTGTLRILALLALFRHPEPPPLIIVEEIENGLDPRTIHLIVEELRNLVESGRSQVIVTTHSPYLLDLLPLWSIVLVERSEDKGPVFSRPDDNPALEKWAEKFGPGKLYTMQGLSLGEEG
ncbi:MAG: ATP-binding protein [Chloroflexota bacterium]|nr:ATP-binding protein [Chloroflexota bacterium]MDE2948703.1 ATP-binding protein [Chloroflexota bacterium]